MSIKKTAETKEIFKSSFSGVIAAGVDQSDWNLISTGAGQGISQSGGNLVMTAGTTANSESIIRTRKSFRGNMDLRYSAILSQRIANNNFFIELVDVLGDDFAFSCSSSTALVITFPDGQTNPFYNPNDTSISCVGQSVYLGNFRSTAGNVLTPGRYTIAAVTPTTVTFTVVGFTSGATGKCSMFGWNYYHVLYDGTTATNAKFDSQRFGWATGDTTLTINTTASPGHLGILSVEDGNVSYFDQLAASSVLLQSTIRGSRNTTIPDFSTPLFLQIRSANGSTAPASGTTFTVGMATVEEIVVESVTINGVRPQAAQSALPVSLVNGLNGQAGQVRVQGIARSSSNNGGDPLYVATGVSANPASVITGRNVDLQATLIGALIEKPYAIPESDWSATAAAGGIVNTTTATTLKAAAGAGVRNYLTGIQISAEALGAATEVVIRDGAAGTVIWRHKISTAGMPLTNITFPSPLKSTANTLLEVATLTASVTGGVFVNAQGYIAP